MQLPARGGHCALVCFDPHSLETSFNANLTHGNGKAADGRFPNAGFIGVEDKQTAIIQDRA